MNNEKMYGYLYVNSSGYLQQIDSPNIIIGISNNSNILEYITLGEVKTRQVNYKLLDTLFTKHQVSKLVQLYNNYLRGNTNERS